MNSTVLENAAMYIKICVGPIYVFVLAVKTCELEADTPGFEERLGMRATSVVSQAGSRQNPRMVLTGWCFRSWCYCHDAVLRGSAFMVPAH
jgi:hypothetical protein